MSKDKPPPKGPSPRRLFNPRASFNFRCNSMELAVLMFTSDDKAAAKDLGVTLEQWLRWKSGEDAVPKLLWLYLTLRKKHNAMGFWKDYYVDGDKLVSPQGDGIAKDEWHKLREYRHAHRLAVQQTELIERLMTERDYYRQQCHKNAKFGLMLSHLFPED
ncbi:hypothetical protein HZU77_015785 [Neisseriaceae bacterium TC5R-5]|nr:hypothetical protein [Neisseriaceae bacterium TC5R-5]